MPSSESRKIRTNLNNILQAGMNRDPLLQNPEKAYIDMHRLMEPPKNDEAHTRLRSNKPVSYHNIEHIIGPGLEQYYEFICKQTEGEQRQYTLGVSALTHPIDVTFRLHRLERKLGLYVPDSARRTSMIHDYCEDNSRTFWEAETALASIRSLFGAEEAEALRIVTNYGSILKSQFTFFLMQQHGGVEALQKEPYEQILDTINKYIQSWHMNLPRNATESEIDDMRQALESANNYFFGDMNLKQVKSRIAKDKKHNIIRAMNLNLYPEYIEKIGSYAAALLQAEDRNYAGLPCLKGCDAIANIRTSVGDAYTRGIISLKAGHVLDMLQDTREKRGKDYDAIDVVYYATLRETLWALVAERMALMHFEDDNMDPAKKRLSALIKYFTRRYFRNEENKIADETTQFLSEFKEYVKNQ